MIKKLKSWINRESKPGMPLWKALLLEHRLPWRYRQTISDIFKLLRISYPFAYFFGKEYERSRSQIEIDITYVCHMMCNNCNRSCTQAPTNQYMTLAQIKKFISESINKKIVWKKIFIVGGEPTLHPQIFDILNLLLDYKYKHAPEVYLQLVSNGNGKKVNEILSKIPSDIHIRNTSKKSPEQNFISFNVAPLDLLRYKLSDYSNGCWITSSCGMGLTPYGYYPCAIAGSIDRVFGFDIGRKELPSLEDNMNDQLKVFCKYCGHFKRDDNRIRVESKSISWKKAYTLYNKRKPTLKLY